MFREGTLPYICWGTPSPSQKETAAPAVRSIQRVHPDVCVNKNRKLNIKAVLAYFEQVLGLLALHVTAECIL